MVAIGQAVESSKQVLGQVMPEFAHLDPEIEEFQLDDDQGLWIITFRARNPQPRGEGESFGTFFAPYIEKVATVSTSDGKLLSIRNRSF